MGKGTVVRRTRDVVLFVFLMGGSAFALVALSSMVASRPVQAEPHPSVQERQARALEEMAKSLKHMEQRCR